MLGGQYSINRIDMYDTTNYTNFAIYYADGDVFGDVTNTSHSLDLNTLNFTIDNPNEVDTEGPVLNSISIRDDTLSPGDTLYIDYDASDESVIGSVHFYLYDL